MMVARIGFLGAESTGKTTIAESLSRHFESFYVPEFFRFYWQAKRNTSNPELWTEAEFSYMAQTQARFEDEFASRPGRFLFCDTALIALSFWQNRYLQQFSEPVERLSLSRPYDRLFFCLDDIPFQHDEYRDGKNIRSDMSSWSQTRLKELAIPYTILSGSTKSRMSIAIKSLQEI